MYSAGHSDRWGAWGEWVWSAEHQRYYHQRQDAYGNIDTGWAPLEQPDVQEPEIPRQTDASIEDITEGIANLQSPGSSNYAYNESYSVASGSSRPKGKSKSKKKHKSGRSKGKHRDDSDSDDDEDTETENDPPYQQPIPSEPSTDAGQYSYDPTTGQQYATGQQYVAGQQYGYNPDPYSQHGMAAAAAGAGYSVHPSLEEDPEEDEEEEMRRAMDASRQYNYGNQTGESSSSGYGASPYYEPEVEQRTSTSSSSRITATPGSYEQLDPRYRVEHSNRFQPGEIFKVLWSEPQGMGADHAPSLVSEREEMRDKYGGKFFVGFRRFIVVANDQGHCTCVPILTYGGKGCNKKGVKAEKHGIIHERGNKARLLQHEPKLGFPPVRVEITEDGEKLSKESRVNYSKLVTVEHNVKVFFIGHVVASDWEVVSDAVNYCWEKKSRYQKKHFR